MCNSDVKSACLLIDKENNIALFPFIPNPHYRPDLDDPMNWRSDNIEHIPKFYSKTPFELKAPCTTHEIAQALEKAFDAREKHEPYTARKKTIEEYYYGVTGFKNATKGIKQILIVWGCNKKSIILSLPSKTRGFYLFMEVEDLPQDANCVDAAKKIQELLNKDVTQCRAYNKKDLNI